MTTPVPEVWLIHGANASPTSFNYLELKLRLHDEFKDFKYVKIKYDSQDPLPRIANEIAEKMPKDRPIFLVGHSLGGVLAVAASQVSDVFENGADIRGVVTIASPLGGSEGADYLMWMFPHYHLFRNISTKSRFIRDLQGVGIVRPTLTLITSAGNLPVFPEANDGVVTLNSQRALRSPLSQEIPYNHFECLLSPDVADRIGSFMNERLKEIVPVKL